ncbi:hypothetical protein CIK05_00135 [Bdellovibrio sp. qaytius]|nr:hypothetical protein CIK05_00135 [Bdellovibrio sp. qaytius]
MKLALQVLDGHHKGQIITLRENYVFSSGYFGDPEMSTVHAEIYLDSNFLWKIRSLDGNKLRAGSSEGVSLSLINGLIFHMGQTGFKVIEKPKTSSPSWEDSLVEFLEADSWEPILTEFFFYLYPVRLTFLSGPQTDEFYTLSYGPRTIGFNSLDLNIKDPTQPGQIAKFFQVGETAYIETLCGDKILINGKPFTQHPIESGDQVTFGANLVELSILK